MLCILIDLKPLLIKEIEGSYFFLGKKFFCYYFLTGTAFENIHDHVQNRSIEKKIDIAFHSVENIRYGSANCKEIQ